MSRETRGKEAADSISNEERGKDCKVKVKYQPVTETEKRYNKREALAEVVLNGLRRQSK